MLRIRGAVEFLLVATDALGGHEVEVGESTVLMTVIAGGGSMSASQRKAVHVHIDLRYRNFPAADRVATLARTRHLAAVNIRVTVGAFVADIGKHHLGMAIHAVDVLVETAQGKSGLVVVKLWNRTNRFPSVHGVAILASDI